MYSAVTFLSLHICCNAPQSERRVQLPLSYYNSYHECDMHILHYYENTTHITSANVQTPTEALKSGECLIKCFSAPSLF